MLIVLLIVGIVVVLGYFLFLLSELYERQQIAKRHHLEQLKLWEAMKE